MLWSFNMKHSHDEEEELEINYLVESWLFIGKSTHQIWNVRLTIQGQFRRRRKDYVLSPDQVHHKVPPHRKAWMETQAKPGTETNKARFVDALDESELSKCMVQHVQPMRARRLFQLSTRRDQTLTIALNAGKIYATALTHWTYLRKIICFSRAGERKSSTK